ncbi:hypothetical protein GCK32_004478 [Trichostrongylus colubriformis]|uniref:Uncharacterized protein n=1 Tax=Trichostrongylus colubriformis TaxID=6319 RepID=A0AAN8IFP5_TRICO
MRHRNDCRLTSILASFLEDDDLSIREEASAILSRHTLKSDIVLNPSVCFRLIFGKTPQSRREFKEQKQNYSHYSSAVDESAEVLFDASSVNPYAETRVFGDFSEVKSMVAGLKEIQ